MTEWLAVVTGYVAIAINAMALVAIAAGAVEAFVLGLKAMLSSPTGHERRDVWLRFARWLVVGLTFQLAADIIETSVAPSWDDIGRLAAIALLRTALNYFLERDLAEMREEQGKSARAASAPLPKAQSQAR
jgi:uncharacterized membrane protein